MALSQIIKIIIVVRSIINIIFIWSIVFKIRKARKERAKLIIESDIFVEEEFGDVNGLVGHRGTGKTTLMSGIAHSQLRTILSELENRLNKIIVNLPNMDFNKLNLFLESSYELGLSIKECSESIMNNYNNYIYHDYINVLTLESMISDYCEYYFNLYFRDCYMYTKGVSFYDRISQSRSKELLDDTLKLKSADKNHTFYPFRASIFNVDEISVSDSNSKSFDKEAKEDGSKEFQIFFRQMMKGLSRYNTTKQIAADEIVTTRRLTVCTWECLGSKDVIYNFPKVQRFLDLILKIRYKLFAFRWFYIPIRSIRQNKMDSKYYSGNCKFRQFEYKINNFKNWLNSKGLLVHTGRLYKYNVVTNKLELVFDNVKLFFPITECWGTYNTNEYSCLYDYLIEKSNLKESDVRYTSRLGNEETIRSRVSFLNKSLVEDDF